MPDIANYAETIKVILGEGGKYFGLLLFSVMAIRFWRSASRVSSGNKVKTTVIACGASAIACGVGYVSIRHSMGLMYSAYGLRSFNSGKLPAAYYLFRRSAEFWRSPDAVGREGVCLVLMNQADFGKQLLDEAKSARHGSRTPFEEFYLGLYYFLSGKPDAATPLLESSSRDSAYRWRVTKLLCVIVLAEKDAKSARRLMEPFANAEIQESDHAYIIACLKLAEGRTNEAQAIVNLFYSENLGPLWKAKFETLQQGLKTN